MEQRRNRAGTGQSRNVTQKEQGREGTWQRRENGANKSPVCMGKERGEEEGKEGDKEGEREKRRDRVKEGEREGSERRGAEKAKGR